MDNRIILYFIISLLFCSCKNDNPKIQSGDIDSSLGSIEEINIRLPRDPQQINPFFAPGPRGREVFQYIFLTLADFHPDDLQLYPILITEIPTGKIESINGVECISYTMELRPDAKWSDGTAISNTDVDFTFKMINHPLGQASGWKPFFTELKSVKTDPNNSKKFTVSFAKDYMLSLEATSTINLMPAHIYDPTAILNKYKITDLISGAETKYDTSETQLFEKINAAANEKIGVIQSGPYTLSSHETNQYVQLKKQEDYWGAVYPTNPFLQAKANKITFKIVPDELTAITMAKEGTIDLMMMQQSQSFLDLKEDNSFNDKWSFHVPQLMRYYYLALNNKTPVLSDKRVRNALAHLADVDDYIENIDGGLGIRTIGHFNPSKSYYNDKLAPIPYDINTAKKILAEAGWSDKDGDGFVEKDLAGKSTTLELDILMTGSNLSKNIALLFQASAAKAGIKINIVTKTMSLLRKENLYTFDYDIAMLAVGLDSNTDDPYRRWHSDNKDNPRDNIVGYSNPKVDKLIEAVRTTKDEALMKKYFFDIQEEMYLDQPCVFLYCPLNKIIISKKYEATATAKRPGYQANTFIKAN